MQGKKQDDPIPLLELFSTGGDTQRFPDNVGSRPNSFMPQAVMTQQAGTGIRNGNGKSRMLTANQIPAYTLVRYD